MNNSRSLATTKSYLITAVNYSQQDVFTNFVPCLKKVHFHFQITFFVSSQDLTILSFKGCMMTETSVILTLESQYNHFFVRIMFLPYFMQSFGLGCFFFLLMDSTIIKNFKTRFSISFILLPSLH